MRKNFLLIILCAIFIISLITFIMIFNYLDPYENRVIGMVSMSIAFFFSMTTFSTVCLYAFKRIYFRGQVFITHLMASFRQSVMISLFFLGSFVFIAIGAPVSVSSLLLAVILICAELFIKNLEA